MCKGPEVQGNTAHSRHQVCAEKSEGWGILVGDVPARVLILMLAGTKLGMRRWDLV